ncbi:Rho guanine nucleotide exchange factor-like protein [Emericellopsis cladophorae]|uniref:Rho guanine nucleotide exchange factor-like protein n=1 Tax=Emericellopsis cladophorae TaxID=2686198 RepID=A0A9Q0BBJ7_9HYPO|nr:Rho guanine nucleotide exchange factor-like protein [Emericellopsis cladophorae]KAI6778731.1 Rho guanine nucleotide exchange factor-like protein [Emericellopsis cladophorae]
MSRVSQLTGSTAVGGSSASLSSLSSMTPGPNGHVVPTSNIINQKADASRSLYQICVALKNRLAQVPDFEQYLDQLDPLDPVDSLWNLLRTGLPLIVIYNNALQPEEPLDVDEEKVIQKPKIGIFKFVKACLEQLQLPSQDCFVVSDVMNNDTSGFVKVTQVVNYVLDLAAQRGNLVPIQPYPDDGPADPSQKTQMTYRDHIVKELVDTERKYVQDLENLHDLKTTLEQNLVIPGDAVHSIFLNINAILDFQRRFLIRVETTNSRAATSQKWGEIFVHHEPSFSIYEPFISNQRKAAMTAQAVFDQIKSIDHPVALEFNTLDGFLLKPMQRLVKYPLLLKDLHKKTEDEETKNDLLAGCEAAERVLYRANEAVNRDLLDEALVDLKTRVDDWKNHNVESFGKLLMHGVHGVATGKTDVEKDYEIYLFEAILLCCKEVSPNKVKDKKDKTKSTGSKPKNKSAKVTLKGRIFMTNVTDVVSLSKPGTGSHCVQIWWKGEPAVENFTIKFPKEDIMRKWADVLEQQRKVHGARVSAQSGSMANDFVWTRDHTGAIENPYKETDDEDDFDGPATAPAQFPMPGQQPAIMPRTSSSSSLRQRSATNDSSQSLAGIARAPPPRFPLPHPPAPLSLSLQTQSSGAISPGSRIGDSYFSPVDNSPASSRTSTASGMFPTYKPGQPQAVWDEGTKYTTAAAPRAPSRDGTSPGPHGMNGRNARGPSLPAMAKQNSAAQNQRSRSYSTPDINGPGVPRQRQPSQGGGNVPAVPGIPQHLHPAHDSGIPRSQNGSPRNDQPIRTHTQSPGAQHRMHQHSGSLGGTMSHFPSQPIYPRGATPNPSSGGNSLRVDMTAANTRTVSPGLGTGTFAPPGSNAMGEGDAPFPTQLKVKVNLDGGNYVTLVVAFNISYQSLIDRIDAKLARFTASSIGKEHLKLHYRDEDGDLVRIQSDEDIQLAFLELREGMKSMYSGGVGEIDLYCISATGA